MKHNKVQELFRTIDGFDTKKFASFITEDGILRFGNQPVVKSRDNIYKYIDNFFRAIKGISHSDLESWELNGVTFVNGMVKYTRHDGSEYPVYFSNTFKMKGDLIDEYLIYVDNSELFKG